MLEVVLIDFNHAKTRWVFAQRAANRAAGDHLHVTRLTVGVTVIMAGEDSPYVVLFHGRQSCYSPCYGEVEVLFRLVFGFQEPRVVLEHQDVLCLGLLCVAQHCFEPYFLLR